MTVEIRGTRAHKKMLHKRAQQQKRDRRIQRAKQDLKILLTTLALKGVKLPPENVAIFERQAAKGKRAGLRRKLYAARKARPRWIWDDDKGIYLG